MGNQQLVPNEFVREWRRGRVIGADPFDDLAKQKYLAWIRIRSDRERNR